jgi:ketosteroid isomerase-like protein
MCTNSNLIELLIAYWKVQDIEMTLRLCHDDVVYQLHVDPIAVPYAGETRGKDAFRETMHHMQKEWDYVRYESVLLGIEDSVARVQTQFSYRHRASGETLAGSKRWVIVIRDGLVARVDDYQDAALIAAFMRLCQDHMLNLGQESGGADRGT